MLPRDPVADDVLLLLLSLFVCVCEWERMMMMLLLLSLVHRIYIYFLHLCHACVMGHKSAAAATIAVC